MSLVQQCREFYDNYNGPKVWFNTFYGRCRVHTGDTMKALISPSMKPHWRTANRRDYSHKYWEIMKWFDSLKEPPMSRSIFYQRLKAWYSKDEALLDKESFDKLSRERNKSNKWTSWYRISTNYISRLGQEENIIERDFDDYIDITLTPEEAKIFRKEYIKMIEDVEWTLTSLEEKTAIKEANAKLEKLKRELNVFNAYNKA